MTRGPATSLTRDDIATTIARVLSILRKQDPSQTCCLTGDSAAMLWGITRVPRDVDVLVMNDANGVTAERAKNYIKDTDTDFYLSPSRVLDPRTLTPYQDLWFRVPGREGVQCRVDILIPAARHTPRVPPRRIVWFGTTPTMPLMACLLHKLQAWDHHHRSYGRPDLQAKQTDDVRDINELLAIARVKHVYLRDTEAWLPPAFISASERRALEYKAIYPFSYAPLRVVGLFDWYEDEGKDSDKDSAKDDDD
ncbi:hypothetical protein OF83DRAFT_1080897 [Amylostereum chailletii]|nr:hypothetical protein OF83DRAFT_1080897 [Amylostereum chailletii]